MLLTKLKASSSCTAISSVTFSSDSKSLLTAGKRHLKFWTITSPRTQINLGTGSLSLHGKPVNLGPHQGSSFISITSALLADGSSGEAFPMYALTESGWFCFHHIYILELKFLSLVSFLFHSFICRCPLPRELWIFSNKVSKFKGTRGFYILS